MPNYEIIAKIVVNGVTRPTALGLVLGMQRNAVKAGLMPANITLVRVTESPDLPAQEITSEAIAALLPPAPLPWQPGGPTRRHAATPRRKVVGVNPLGVDRRTGVPERRIAP